jgi:hypothetical protein
MKKKISSAFQLSIGAGSIILQYLSVTLLPHDFEHEVKSLDALPILRNSKE